MTEKTPTASRLGGVTHAICTICIAVEEGSLSDSGTEEDNQEGQDDMRGHAERRRKRCKGIQADSISLLSTPLLSDDGVILGIDKGRRLGAHRPFSLSSQGPSVWATNMDGWEVKPQEKEKKIGVPFSPPWVCTS